jgi:hypothetical protein
MHGHKPVAAGAENPTRSSGLLVGVLELHVHSQLLTLLFDNLTELVMADAPKICCHTRFLQNPLEKNKGAEYPISAKLSSHIYLPV